MFSHKKDVNDRSWHPFPYTALNKYFIFHFFCVNFDEDVKVGESPPRIFGEIYEVPAFSNVWNLFQWYSFSEALSLLMVMLEKYKQPLKKKYQMRRVINFQHFTHFFKCEKLSQGNLVPVSFSKVCLYFIHASCNSLNSDINFKFEK